MKRVITLQEPWASLIGEGIKTIETRSWACNQFGELYIHAGLAPIRRKDTIANAMAQKLKGPLHYGQIFLKCNLVDCVLIDENYANQIAQENYDNYLCGDYTAGRFAWIISDVESIDPITAKGHLSIWNFSIGEE